MWQSLTSGISTCCTLLSSNICPANWTNATSSFWIRIFAPKTLRVSRVACRLLEGRQICSALPERNDLNAFMFFPPIHSICIHQLDTHRTNRFLVLSMSTLYIIGDVSPRHVCWQSTNYKNNTLYCSMASIHIYSAYSRIRHYPNKKTPCLTLDHPCVYMTVYDHLL